MSRYLILLSFLLLSGFMNAGAQEVREWVERGQKCREAQDYKGAFECFSKSARMEDAGSQNALGELYRQGQGVDTSYVEAMKWFALSASQGFARAQCNLGNMYMYGTGVKGDDDEALFWLLKAAEQGYAPAQSNYAVIQFDRKEYLTALEWYRKAAAQDWFPSIKNIAIMQHYGQGIPVDGVAALEGYKRASAAGLKQATCNIGDIYRDGVGGVERDYAEAMVWYRKAAEGNYVRAIFSVGELYEKGWGVEPDDEEALMWYRKAAALGYKPAQVKLDGLEPTDDSLRR